MTNSLNDNQKNSAVKSEAELVQRDYGDCAPVYAKVRAEAAGTRGDPDAAEHWEQVRDDLGKEESCEHAQPIEASHFPQLDHG